LFKTRRGCSAEHPLRAKESRCSPYAGFPESDAKCKNWAKFDAFCKDTVGLNREYCASGGKRHIHMVVQGFFDGS
jgi:hypothetical protein